MKCFVLSWGPKSCQLSLIKASILFINHCSIVLRSTFVYLQPLFATYALKWKDYHLTLISIRYLGCFVPVLCHFAVSENPSRFSLIQIQQAGTSTQARQTRIPFLGMITSEVCRSAATARAERPARHATVSTCRAPPVCHPPASPLPSASHGTHTSRLITPPPPEGSRSPRPACLARQSPAGAPGRPTAPYSNSARAGAHGHEPEQYGDRTLHARSKVNEARSCKAGRGTDERLPTPRAPEPTTGPTTPPAEAARRPPPPQRPPPRASGDAGPPRTHRPAKTGASDPKPGSETNGPGHPPPRAKKAENGTGAGSEEGQEPPGTALPAPCNGTARGARATRTQAGGARTRREHMHTHTQQTRGADPKGTRTEFAERTDRMVWRTSRQREGTPESTARNRHRKECKRRGGHEGRNESQHRP